ncbi:hypothetical protein HaLaN_29521, partial [Haematococcus lacustris]
MRASGSRLLARRRRWCLTWAAAGASRIRALPSPTLTSSRLILVGQDG